MNAQTLEKKWPLVESHLRVGDILLFHKRRGWMSRLIRWRSKSYWNHSALVFKDQDIIKYGSPLIIEAFDDGIEVHRLQKYTGNFQQYDIGVKRFVGLSVEERSELVKSFMLNNIDVPYDYGVLVTYLFSNMLEKISRRLYSLFTKFLVKEDAYVCSSFIRNAFNSFKRKRAEEKGDPELAKLEQEHLVTPGMIAADKDFDWVFNKHK